MGRFLDEPTKTYKGKFLDEAMSPSDNSIYSKGGDFDIKKRLGSFSDGPKVLGIPVKERILSGVQAGLPAMFGGATNVEDALPMMGQVAGGAVGDTVNPVIGGVGGTIGATAGQAVRQGVKGLRGYKPSFGEIASEPIKTGVNELIFRGAGKFAEPITNRLMISALKPSKEVVRRNPRFGSDAADLGLFGTLNNMKKQSQGVMNENVPIVKNALRGKTQRVKALDIAAELDDLKRPFLNVGDDASAQTVDDLQNAILKKADQNGSIGVEEAQQFKQDLYKVLKDSSWGRGQGEIPLKATARKQAAHGLKEGIETAVPEVALPNKKIGTSVEALEGISKQQEKSLMKSVLPWVETIGTAGSLITGNPLIAAAILARRGAMSPTFLSGSSQASRLLAKPQFGKPAMFGASELSRRIGREDQ